MKTHNTRQLVRNILKEHPYACDNANLLLSLFWKAEGVNNLNQISAATPAGSIIRAKQYIMRHEADELQLSK